MDRIFEAIEEWMRNLLTGMVSSNLTTMYTDVNEKTGRIAAQVGQTPQGWKGTSDCHVGRSDCRYYVFH